MGFTPEDYAHADQMWGKDGWVECNPCPEHPGPGHPNGTAQLHSREYHHDFRDCPDEKSCDIPHTGYWEALEQGLPLV